MKKTFCLSILAVFCLCLTGCGQRMLVAQDGEEYSMVSFNTKRVKLTSGEKTRCRIITFSYLKDETLAKGVGVIKVPVEKVTIDRTLTPGGVIWDRPVTVEGKTYQTARWNPRKMEDATGTDEILMEEEPLRRR